MRPEQEDADVRTRRQRLSSCGNLDLAEHIAFEIPPTEKILRTLGVCLGVAIIMRLAGKRQLAQLNSFDLIVMLLLSNVVQNVVIGPDNSLMEGLLRAVVLVGLNAVFEWVAMATKRTT